MEAPTNTPNNENESVEISIIIPAFNESQFIGNTLQSLQETEFPKNKFEIIVVDNGSSDNTVAIAERLADIVDLLPDGNVGAVRNYGARLASGKVLVFIDADCTVERTWLPQVHQLATQQNGEIIYGGICKVRKDANWIERLWLLEGKERYQKDLTGACIVVKKTTFLSVGGFSEELTAGEDTDFSQRLRAAGKTVKVCSDFFVTHLGNANTIKKFIKRQAWHGENYFLNIYKSVKDPTFLLCILAILSFSIGLISILLGIKTTAYAIFIPPFIPIIFSAKRMTYARFFSKNPVVLIKIYILDAAYVFGRCMGIIKSATPSR